MNIFGRKFLILIFCLFIGAPASSYAGDCRELFSLLWRSSKSTFIKPNPTEEARRIILYETKINELNQSAVHYPSLPRSMRVLLWNTYKGFMPGWDSDVQWLLSKTDLALFQEVRLSPRNSLSLEASGLFWSMAPNYFSDSDTANGVVTGARATPLSVSDLKSPDGEFLTKVPKTILISEYSIQGTSKTLLNINVHGLAFVFLPTLINQLQQLDLILASHKGPIILAGDFNTWTTARKNRLKEFAAGHHLTPVPFPNPKFRELDAAYTSGLIIENPTDLSEVDSSNHIPRAFQASVKN